MEKSNCCDNSNCNNCDQERIFNKSNQNFDDGTDFNETDFDQTDFDEMTFEGQNRNSDHGCYKPKGQQIYPMPCNPHSRSFIKPSNRQHELHGPIPREPCGPILRESCRPILREPCGPVQRGSYIPIPREPYDHIPKEPCGPIQRGSYDPIPREPYGPIQCGSYDKPCDPFPYQQCNESRMDQYNHHDCRLNDLDINPDPRHNSFSNMNNYPHNNQKYNDCIDDTYLLKYLLKKYNLDKQKLICSIQKTREKNFKRQVICNFYEDNAHLINRPFIEQYRMFKEWNHDGIHISKEDFENYYERYIKCLNQTY